MGTVVRRPHRAARLTLALGRAPALAARVVGGVWATVRAALPEEQTPGSAAEVTVALRIAVAKRYVLVAEVAEVEALLDHVRAMLWRLTHL